MEIPFFAFLAAFYLLYLFIICRKAWRRSPQKLAFSILEIWAFMLGISPTMFAFGYTMQHGIFEQFSVPILMAFLGQCAGFYIAIVDRFGAETHLNGAVSVFFGTLGGLGLAIGFVLLAWLIMLVFLVFLATLVFTFGLAAIPYALIAVALFSRRKAKTAGAGDASTEHPHA